jgi:hypothetical protein
MIEKINVLDNTRLVEDRDGFTVAMPDATIINKINELVDAVNELQTPAENVQNDHYWYKQQERYKAALVLIRDLSGAGMSYHDMCIESREIAKWALDPDYKPLLIGRYSKDDQELFDTLRETKGGDNE